MKNKLLLPLAALLLVAAISCKTTTNEVKNRLTSETPMPEWAKDAVIYEVNLRQYTNEGTIAAFETHLPRLKELGVDILWFMPVHPIGEKNRKGGLGSYYSVKDYKAINPEFGSMEDFKNMVNKAHELGFKVIIDWVANHTAWDHAWVNTNPDYYAKDSTGNMYGPYDWTDVAQLDFSNQQLRADMIDALKFWVAEANIDGYRCDVAGKVPVDFWEAATKELNSIKPVFMLAEDEDEEALLNKAFNANYGWSFHSLMNRVAKGEKNVTDITAYLAHIDTIYPTGSFPMQFTSNHDENSWNGTEYERMGNAHNTFATLSFTVTGMPLIYTGQEAGLNKRLLFFEKDMVNWDNLAMSEFYKKLIDLKTNNPALHNGSFGGNLMKTETSQPEKALVFERIKDNNHVVAVFNLSPETITINAGTLAKGDLNDYFTGKTVTFPLNNVELQPWEYKVFVK
jgi:glycosidase